MVNIDDVGGGVGTGVGVSLLGSLLVLFSFGLSFNSNRTPTEIIRKIKI